MSQNQIAGQSHNMKNVNISFERVEDLKHLETTLKKQNYFQEKLSAD